MRVSARVINSTFKGPVHSPKLKHPTVRRWNDPEVVGSFDSGRRIEWACFPGMAVIFTPMVEEPDAISTRSTKQVSHLSNAATAVKFSGEGDLGVNMDFA